MDTINHILVPLDFSDNLIPFLKIGKRLSEKLGAHLHVIGFIDESIFRKHQAQSPKLSNDFLEGSRNRLNTLIKDSGLEGLEHTSEVVPGVPFMEIITQAASIPADLIMLGGLASESGYKIGHDSFKIIRMAPFNTLLIRTKKKEPSEGSPNYRILVAMDFSKHSLLALDRALYLKPALDAEIHVFQVIAEKGPIGEEEVRDKLQRILSAEQFKEIGVIEVKSSRNPTKEIIKKVNESHIDLLSIGSHSRERYLKTLFLGKVSYDVVRKVDCSLLIVKDL